MDERRLAELLDRVAAGTTSVDRALDTLRVLPYEDVDGAKLDHHRELRTGQVEAVFGPGKSPQEVHDAVAALAARASGAVFVTRATEEQARAARQAVPSAYYDPRSRLVVVKRTDRSGPPAGSVAVVAAGTSDIPVAEEAAQTADALGLDILRVTDVGVAGIHRLLAHRERVDEADCAIVVAGMEGALPSAVAGLTRGPVIAVPTSVGYGASFEGIAALLAMLSSCAPGVAVVNIDNGFGAAHVAHRILVSSARREGPGTETPPAPRSGVGHGLASGAEPAAPQAHGGSAR